MLALRRAPLQSAGKVGSSEHRRLDVRQQAPPAAAACERRKLLASWHCNSLFMQSETMELDEADLDPGAEERLVEEDVGGEGESGPVGTFTVLQPEALEFNDCLCVYMGALDAVLSLAVVGNIFFSGSIEGSIHGYDLETGALVQNLKGHTSWVIKLVHRGGRLISASRDCSIRSWDLATSECVGSVVLPSPITSVDCCGGLMYVGCHNQGIHVLDMNNSLQGVKVLQGIHLAAISALFCISERELLSGSYDRLAKRVVFPEGSTVALYHSSKIPFGISHVVRSLAYEAESDIAFVGSSDGKIRAYQGSSGETLFDIAVCVGPVLSLLIADGRLYSGSDDGIVRRFKVGDGVLEYEYKGHSGGVTALALGVDSSSGGCQLFSGSYDHSVRCWDIAGTTRILDILEAQKLEEEKRAQEAAAQAAAEAATSKQKKPKGKGKKK